MNLCLKVKSWDHMVAYNANALISLVIGLVLWKLIRGHEKT